MIVQGDGFSYALENRLVSKLDIMIDRVMRKKPKLDAWLQIEGSEGTGKSNTASAIAYYLKQETGFDVHLFFRLQKLIDFAQATEKKIIIWDEPSLDSLSTDQIKRLNKDLLRLAMTCRKKRHFFIINFTKFWKFSEYLVVDRCLGMVHMYSRDGINVGRFVYIKKKSLELLWNDYKRSRRRSYGKLCAFRGNFPEIIEDNFEKLGFFVEGKPNATYNDYETIKSEAILSIGKDDVKENKTVINLKNKLNDLRCKIGKLIPKDIETREELSVKLGISSSRLREWAKFDDNTPISLEN